MSQALLAGEALAARLADGRGGWDGGVAMRYHLGQGLHHLMLWAPGRRAAVRVCRRWPGVAQALYRWSRS